MVSAQRQAGHDLAKDSRRQRRRREFSKGPTTNNQYFARGHRAGFPTTVGVDSSLVRLPARIPRAKRLAAISHHLQRDASLLGGLASATTGLDHLDSRQKASRLLRLREPHHPSSDWPGVDRSRKRRQGLGPHCIRASKKVVLVPTRYLTSWRRRPSTLAQHLSPGGLALVVACTPPLCPSIVVMRDGNVN